MAEHQLPGTVLGVICDGTGYGTDGGIWGGEFLLGGYEDFERRGHLAYVPLVGGEASIRRPPRMAFSYLWQALGEEALSLAERFLPSLAPGERELMRQQLRLAVNTWPTSSCGRLFDGVAAFLGVCEQAWYEGQAAIELEALAERAGAEGRPPLAELPPGEMWEIAGRTYPLLPEGRELPVDGMWRELVEDRLQGAGREMVALRFHLTLAEGIMRMALCIREDSGVDRVVLSGGCMQNRILLRAVGHLLEGEGFQVYSQQLVPPNDGGLALGQAAVAIARVSRRGAAADEV